MQMNHCVSCMEGIGGYPCPHCGFDPAKEAQPLFALPWNTILHGRYLVGKVLGQGGFGITYVGWDLLLDMKVAIKEYYPSGQATRQNASTKLLWYTTGGRSPEGDGGNAFLKEARKMAKIGGIPEIVRVLDTFCENETAYIVMEFVEGETLKALAEKNGIMSFDECAKLLLPLLEGLDKVHTQGLIHRDISPDNIMRQADGTLRLLDFGAAKDTSAMRNGNSQLVAKHGFSPVEQYTATGEVGPWTDVYALCATMYYLLAGEAPPQALERLDGDTLDFSKIKRPLTDRQRAILASGLAVRKENRIQSAAALAEQLKGTAVPPQPPEEPKPTPKKGKGKLILGVCAAVAAVAAAAIWGTRAMRPAEPVTVEELGCTNAALDSYSMLMTFQDENFYYTDKDWGLYVSPYDTEDKTFYIGTEGKEALDERAFCLNKSESTLYYIHDGDRDDTMPDTIYAMETGSGRKTALVKGGQYMYLQYARLSDGKEYLYYFDTAEGDQDDYIYQLFRYDLEAKESERVLEEEAHWYNLAGEYLHYITFEDVSRGTQWKRAALDGENPEVVNESDSLIYGFIEEGTAYLFSRSKELLLQFDLEGNSVNAPLNLYYGTVTYGDGWLYYTLSGSRELHRVLPNGSNDTVILENRNILTMSYEYNYLWVMEQDEVNGEVIPVQCLLVPKNGGTNIEVDERITASGGLTRGVEYTLDGDVLILTGYTGEEDRIIVPWEVAGVTLSDIKKKNDFPDIPIYIYPQESELTWEIAGGGSSVVLTQYTPGFTEGYPYLIMPAEVGGMPVAGIGEDLFEKNKTLKGVILQEGVRTIGETAFLSCSELSHVELPGSLRVIGREAFWSCRALTSMVLPYGLEEVGAEAFEYAGLEYVHIPATLTKIDGNPFNNNGLLKEITADAGNPVYSAVEGALYGNSTLIAAPTGQTGTLTIQPGTQVVGDSACCFSKYSRIVLPSSVKTIERWGFGFCSSITSITLPDGLNTIGRDAFYGCSKLTKITIPQSVTHIEKDAFESCTRLKSADVPTNCQMEDGAFEDDVQINYY